MSCPRENLRSDRTQLLAHAELSDYAGCYIIQFGSAPIVSLPDNDVESYRHVVVGWQSGVVWQPSVIQTAFHERIEKIIGPAFIGYTDANLFRQGPTNSLVRAITDEDEEAFGILRDACPTEDWDHGGSTFRPEQMAGVFTEKSLVALASYQIWGANIAHISIVTHPGFRGCRYATIAVSELTRIVLQRKLVPQYRTLEANQPSMLVAARIGFVRYATSLAVRFKS